MASSLLRLYLPRPPSAFPLSSSSLPQKLSSLIVLPFATPPSFTHPRSPLLPSLSRRLFSSASPHPLSPPSAHPPIDQDPAFQVPEEYDSDNEPELGHEEGEETRPVVASPLPRLPSPKLSIKEKKELASYAHSLGKKLKTQQVGKSGVTPSVAAAFVENLEANELLKLKIHGSCPGELDKTIKQLEQATGSIAVGQIGRSVILYRPSLSKMQKKETQNTRNAWNAKSPKGMSTSKMQKKRKAFAPGSKQNHSYSF